MKGMKMSARSYRRRDGLAVIAGLTVLPLAISGCTSSDDGADAGSASVTGGDNTITLTVQDTYASEPDNTNYQTILDTCGVEIGAEIERTVVPNADLIAKVLQQASSKTLPDVLMLDNPDLQQIAATGALAPLSDFGVSADGYIQGVVDAATYEGEVYGLQPIANTIALFYNEDLLNAADVAVPTNWDELKAAAAALTSGDQYGIAFSAPANFEATWQFLPFMWTAGGSEDDLTAPPVADALQLWVDLVKSDSASESVVTWKQQDVNDQFIAGKAAMMINGPWQIPTLNTHPEVNFAIATIPGPTTGMDSVAPLGGETWTIPNTGDDVKMAKAAELLVCLNSDVNQLSLATARQTVPTKIALQDQFIAENPQMATFSTMVLTARARTGLLGESWPAAATEIYTAIQSALVGGLTPEEALQQAVDG